MIWNKKNFINILILSFFYLPQVSLANVLSAGTLENSIWFSRDPFFVSDAIIINTFLYNSSEFDLEGTLTLFDGTVVVGSKNFSFDGDGASAIVSFPWIVTPGEHSFNVMISNAKFKHGDMVTTDTLAADKTTPIKRFADLDTDKDGTGNLIDTDDDNDTILDSMETRLKTDPLNPDTDGDGIQDQTDKDPLVAFVAPVTLLAPTGTIDRVSGKISEHIPEPVKKTAIPLIGNIEDYRLRTVLRMDDKIDHAVKKIITLQAGTTSPIELIDSVPGGWEIFRQGAVTKEIIHSPFEYAKLFFLLVMQFVINNIYVFYVATIITLYFVIKIIWSFTPWGS